MAKSKGREESQVASLDPSEMLAGGLKDDFRARVTEAVYVPWDYDGNIDEPVLAARLTMEELDSDGEPVGGEEGTVVQHWSAGDLAAFVPSQDGKTPTDGEGMDAEPGPYALRVGKRAQLNNNTNFAHMITSVIDCGEASGHFTKKELTSSLECLEGLDAHWNRVPQKKRSGLVEAEGEQRRARDVLVVTEVYGYGEASAPAAKGKAAGKSSATKGGASKASAKADTNGGADDLDGDIEAAIVEALGENDPIKKSKLATLMLKAFADRPKLKGKAVKRCTEDEFLSDGDRAFTYDEDAGTVSMG